MTPSSLSCHARASLDRTGEHDHCARCDTRLTRLPSLPSMMCIRLFPAPEAEGQDLKRHFGKEWTMCRSAQMNILIRRVIDWLAYPKDSRLRFDPRPELAKELKEKGLIK